MAFENETRRFKETIEATSGDAIVGFIHDRTDPDALGWVVLTHRLLRERFGKSFAAFYSKKIAFVMNRMMVKSFVPAGVLGRIEENRELAREWLDRSNLILVGDTSSPETITGLRKYLKSDDGANKPLLFIDHHARAEQDLEDLPNAVALRIESAQSTTSLMLHIMRNLGVELDGNDESQMRAAVVARLGIEIDLIGYTDDKVSASVRESLAYLDKVIGEKGESLVRRLRQIKIAQGWYVHLAHAMRELPWLSPNLGVVGLGVLDDNGILPFVANELMATGHFKSVMVFGIVYDKVGPRLLDIDLEASGRSKANSEIGMPDLFAKVFYYHDDQGRKVSRGGGRTNEVFGDVAGAGASVPLKYWLDMKSVGAEKQMRLLAEHAWPAEFARIRAQLAASYDIKPEQILDVADGDRTGESPEDSAE